MFYNNQVKIFARSGLRFSGLGGEPPGKIFAYTWQALQADLIRLCFTFTIRALRAKKPNEKTNLYKARGLRPGSHL